MKFIKENYLYLLIIFLLISKCISLLFNVSGIIYNIFMIFAIILNIFILILFRKDIKSQIKLYTFFFIFIFMSEDIYFFILLLSTFLLLSIFNFMKSLFVKIFIFFISAIFSLIFPVLILFIFIMIDTWDTRDNIYLDTYYRCSNGYEIYIDSFGAMDGFHYNKVKNIKMIYIKDILEVVYTKSIEIEKSEYDNILNNYSCRLVGEKNE